MTEREMMGDGEGEAWRRLLGAAAGDPLAGLRRMVRVIEELPPQPREVRTSHAVPYGRCYRQWLTNGDLVLWVNRGEIEDLPRAKVYGMDVVVSSIVPPGGFGVPVVNY